MKEAIIKVFKGAIIAGVGALATYLITELGKIDFGQLTPFVVAGLSVLANFLRKFIPIAAAKTVLKTLLVLFLFAIPAQSQNLASEWSWGPSIPMTRFPFDGSQKSYLPAGLGIGLYRNGFIDDSGSVARLTLGLPIYFQGASDPNAFILTTGLTLGTFNNLIAAGIAADLVNAANGLEPGGFFDGVGKEDFSFILSFNLNLGSGEPASIARRTGSIATGDKHAGPPPNYYRLW